ncbi:cell cycle control protein 50B isoform X2 [Alligator mississippiensis]|uniref:Cell cycle control protein n=1 Tax=Alligator mississippiensis TaxID=8496 RepID=A0A151MLL1_ALLMI|nr:cell cycle control protein 50B isoform X2 [Alligator mississippiensis]KYO25437.1 cell cycle control protein 50B [Alligator mississippiensis]
MAAARRERGRPDRTAFTQQRLPAWQPLLSAGIALPLFFTLGLAGLAVGLGLHFSSGTIRELELDYTGALGSNQDCARCTNASATSGPCLCTLHFELAEPFPGPVCLYYQLSNYYQNHRRYGVSRDDLQLSGDPWGLRHPAEECWPYRRDPRGQAVAPCGAVANSLFNDTFALHRLVNGSFMPVPLDSRGISWWTDSNVKFRNPELVNGSLATAFWGTSKPPNWPCAAYLLDAGNPNNTGFVNEDFIVWMRTAALPTFRKLYRRVHQGNFSAGLPRGTYRLDINYSYPVLPFKGTKKKTKKHPDLVRMAELVVHNVIREYYVPNRLLLS